MSCGALCVRTVRAGAREGTVLELRAEEAGSIAPILAGCSSPAERRR